MLLQLFMFYENSCNNSFNSEFTSAFFLTLKIHKAEMPNCVPFFVYILLLCEKIKKSQSKILLRI